MAIQTWIIYPPLSAGFHELVKMNTPYSLATVRHSTCREREILVKHLQVLISFIQTASSSTGWKTPKAIGKMSEEIREVEILISFESCFNQEYDQTHPVQ